MSTSAKCPLCRNSAQAPWQPFCSAACKDRDLLAWLNESYRLPGQEEAEESQNPLDKDDTAGL